MSVRIRYLGLALLAVVVLGIGLARLRLDVDIFNLLPTDSDAVAGLKLYQQSFGAANELILSVRSEDAATTEEATRSLVESLSQSGLTPQVIWRSPFQGQPESMGEILAFLWLNQSPERFAEMAARFEGEATQQALDEALERLATSLRPEEVARLANDPFGLSEVASELTDSLDLGAGAGDPFASKDGSLRILFVEAPFEKAGFFKVHRWVEEVREQVAGWSQNPSDPTVVRITGNLAFVSETGSGLMGDMQWAAVGTLLLVATLFYSTHRRWAPLGWLVCLLVLILSATASLGGLLLGTLNAVSLGFATILLGLAADYGLILYQELIADPQRSAAEHRRRVAPSILWAAVTTAGAFALIGRSSLPGLSQLGILVALGILIAAIVMLLFFLPPIARRIAAKASTETPRSRPLKSPAFAGWATGLALALSAAVLVIHGLPAVAEGTRDLGPKEGQARDALQEVQEVIGGLDDGLWLLVSGGDESQVLEGLQGVATRLERAVDDGQLESYLLPDVLWPQPDAQRRNRPTAADLAGRFDATRGATIEAGFTEESLRLTEAVFSAWADFAREDGVSWPERPGARWLTRRFATHGDDQQLALGRLKANEQTSPDDLKALERSLTEVPGTHLVAWSLLSDELIGRMKIDAGRVLWPMAIALVVLLGLAFRRPTEIALSIAVLAFSLLALLAVMSAVGWSWNLMNVMALPLLFGAGVDYSIHIQLALRRHGGSLEQTRRTVGQAILLCGASTASGFGTLTMASNSGLASLGGVCAAGIVIASLCSVFLLPVWWHKLCPPDTSSPTESAL